MKLNYKPIVWIMAILAGLSFDTLFWDKPFGINFFFFITWILLGGLIPFWLEKIKIPWTSYLLIIPAVFFAAITFVRAEPFTIVIGVLVTLGSLVLLSMTLRNGAWYQFRFRDHFANFFKLFLNTIVGGFLFFLKVKNAKTTVSEENAANGAEEADADKSKHEGEANTTSPDDRPFIKKAAPYLRGILFALPVLAILTMLLASADPVFNDRIQNLFSWFSIDSLGETVFRLFYILVLAYVILSVYFYSLFKSQEWEGKKEQESPSNAVLGSIEATIMLGSINLLFLVFVLLQFTYLFGGQSNINIEGFTYAEYARRGFSELLAVALVSLFVFYVLSMITRRETKTKQWTFSALGLLLVGLVTIILVSAYTRLTLYEEAYGFTRLRTLTHVFMIWTGLLLAGTAVLDILKKMDRMALILIVMIFGFGISIALLNVDQFIVQQNISRSISGGEQNESVPLDTGYLYSLSADAVPPLANFFQDPNTPEELKDDIGGVLACRAAAIDQQERRSWTSWHYSHSRADDWLNDLSGALSKYPIIEDQGYYVLINGERRSCVGDVTPFFD